VPGVRERCEALDLVWEIILGIAHINVQLDLCRKITKIVKCFRARFEEAEYGLTPLDLLHSLAN
jgi:hypothetical protein